MSQFAHRSLNDTLSTIAADFGFDAGQLIAYANEDPHKGWPTPPWSGGSIWEVDGKILYALVRAINPLSVLECGTFEGCGATHILEALKANDNGSLLSVTLEGGGGNIPVSLLDRWKLIGETRAEDFLEHVPATFDFAWEDTDHTYETTTAILAQLKARPDVKWIVSHDIDHEYTRKAMTRAWTEAFGVMGQDWQAYMADPADTGLAIWRRGQ